jgi:serine/threonine-protein kinase
VSDQPSQTADLGEVIGGYRLEALLGRGGMGRVFVASHVKLGRKAAVKVIAARFVNDEQILARFLREAKVVNDVRHPNIVDIFDFVEIDEPRRVACIMELLDGPSLKDLLAKRPLSSKQAVHATLQLASALEAVHAIGIVHRDLKPANVVVIGALDGDLADAPSVKLLDFGIAKVIADAPAIAGDTDTGAMLGTPAYMAPEQIAGDVVTGAADVFALGELLFEMLTGEKVYPGAAPLVLRQKMSEQPPDLDALTSIVRGDRLRAVIERCLLSLPSARPSPAWVRSELTKWLEAKSTPPAPTPSPSPSPSPMHSAKPSEVGPNMVIRGIDANGQLILEPVQPKAARADAPTLDSRPLDLDLPGPPARPSAPEHPPRRSSSISTPMPTPRRSSSISTPRPTRPPSISGASPPARAPSHVGTIARKSSMIRDVPRPKRRVRGWVVLFAALGIAIVVFSDRLLSSLDAPIREIAKKVGATDDKRGEQAIARGENPLQKTIAEWKERFGTIEGPIESHLAAANAHHRVDRFEAYARAEEEIERVLVLEPKHPEALAFFVENAAIWKSASMRDEERTLLNRVVVFASALAPSDPPVLRAKAALALLDHNDEACRRFAEQALQHAPEDQRARLLLASALAMRDADRAIEEAERASTLERRNRVIARAEASGGRYHAALKTLERASPKNARAAMLAGDFFRELGDDEAALARYRQAVEWPGDRTGMLLEIGALALRTGKLKLAEDSFRSAAEDAAAPSAYRERANVGLARTFMAAPAFITAYAKDQQRRIEAAIGDAPTSDAGRLLRAEIWLRDGEDAKAEALAEAVLVSSPGETAALLFLAGIAKKNGRRDQAIARATEALRSDPHDAEARATLASLFAALYLKIMIVNGVETPRDVGALRQFHDVIQDACALDPLERVQPRTGFDDPEAGHGIAFLVEHDELRADASAMAALVHRQLRMLPKARAMIDRALKADPANPLALLYDAVLALERGDKVQAELAINRVIAKNGTSAIAHLVRARILDKKQRADEARAEREMAIRFDPNLFLAAVEENAADLKGTKEKRAHAIAELQRLIREHPRSPAPKRALYDAGL